MAALGEEVVLQCIVEAYPEPKMMFWRDPKGRVPVILSGKYEISTQAVKDVSRIEDASFNFLACLIFFNNNFIMHQILTFKLFNIIELHIRMDLSLNVPYIDKLVCIPTNIKDSYSIKFARPF